MLKKVGIMLLVILIMLPASYTTAFADVEESSLYGANTEYALGPNSTAYHEIKVKTALLLPKFVIFNITNLATSPGEIMIRVMYSDTGQEIKPMTIINPGEAIAINVMIPPDLSGNEKGIVITITTGSAAGIYRYQL